MIGTNLFPEHTKVFTPIIYNSNLVIKRFFDAADSNKITRKYWIYWEKFGETIPIKGYYGISPNFNDSFQK